MTRLNLIAVLDLMLSRPLLHSDWQRLSDYRAVLYGTADHEQMQRHAARMEEM